MKDNKCSDCTNDKGCINCENGNMYEKTKQEMLKVTPNEDFEAFAKEYMEENDANIVSFYDRYAGLVDGVRWQKVQIMKDAVECKVHIDAGGYPYINGIELYDYDKDVPLAKKGDKVKVIIIKEE